MIGLKAVLLILISFIAFAKEPLYTEDVTLFKSEEFNARMELVVGCWLYAK